MGARRLIAVLLCVVVVASLTGCTALKSLKFWRREPVTVAEPEKVMTYTVKKGDSLWKIAGYEEIYGNSSKWKRIYEANTDKLPSPDAVLKPGMVLTIPRD